MGELFTAAEDLLPVLRVDPQGQPVQAFELEAVKVEPELVSVVGLDPFKDEVGSDGLGFGRGQSDPNGVAGCGCKVKKSSLMAP